MKATLIALAIIVVTVAAAGQDLRQQCGDHPNLLRDSSGSPKWFTSEELQGMATKSPSPDPIPLPGGAKYKGVVSAKIMVNTNGDVVCLWKAAGHPIMMPSAIRTIHEWKFKPMLTGGKPVEFVGELKVPVSSS